MVGKSQEQIINMPITNTIVSRCKLQILNASLFGVNLHRLNWLDAHFNVFQFNAFQYHQEYTIILYFPHGVKRGLFASFCKLYCCVVIAAAFFQTKVVNQARKLLQRCRKRLEIIDINIDFIFSWWKYCGFEIYGEISGILGLAKSILLYLKLVNCGL